MAENTGTFQRNAQHALCRTVNSLSQQMELSSQQAALCLAGHDFNHLSHELSFCWGWAALSSVVERLEEVTAVYVNAGHFPPADADIVNHSPVQDDAADNDLLVHNTLQSDVCDNDKLLSMWLVAPENDIIHGPDSDDSRDDFEVFDSHNDDYTEYITRLHGPCSPRPQSWDSSDSDDDPAVMRMLYKQDSVLLPFLPDSRPASPSSVDHMDSFDDDPAVQNYIDGLHASNVDVSHSYPSSPSIAKDIADVVMPDSAVDVAASNEADVSAQHTRALSSSASATAYRHPKSGKVLFATQIENFRCRGEALQMMSIFEYGACVVIAAVSSLYKKRKKASAYKKPVPGADDVDTDDNSAGDSENEIDPDSNISCRRNARFDFDKRSVLHGTHIQRLRSVPRIPQLVGSSAPPIHPGPEMNTKKWRTRMDRFAKFALAVFVPWTTDDDFQSPHGYAFSVGGLADFMEDCDKAESMDADFLALRYLFASLFLFLLHFHVLSALLCFPLSPSTGLMTNTILPLPCLFESNRS